jgi:dTDP-4-amino-4,6-dideoxygalactose transaminase
MTEMQAVLGRIQLRRLPEWNARRHENATLLVAALKRVKGLRVPVPPEAIRHAWYKFYVFVESAVLNNGWSRDRIMLELEAAGVPCSVGSCSEIYREKAFIDAGWGPAEPLPVARELGEASLCFQIHPTLNAVAMQVIADTLRSIMRRATVSSG